MSPEEQALLAELNRHPAWPILRRLVGERMDAEFRRLANELLRGEQIEQIAVEFRRGFFAGMGFVLDQPQIEAASLARELAKRKDVKLDA